jgi:hypothetical protein
MTRDGVQTDLLQPYVLLHLMNDLFAKGDVKELSDVSRAEGRDRPCHLKGY